MGSNPRLEEPYDLSPERTVMLGVDFQQGFGDGAWEHTPDAAEAVTNFGAAAASWRRAGGRVIMCREILVSGLREYLAGLAVRLPVTRLAKWKTGLQMAAIGTLLAGDPGAARLGLAVLPIGAIGEAMLWVAVGFVVGLCAVRLAMNFH